MKARILVVAVGAAIVSLFPAMASAAERSTLDLSSWTPITEGSEFVGGTRTVTVTNYRSEAVDDIVFDLSENPCACSATSISASRGSVSDTNWVIGHLEAGETVSLTIEYARGQEAVTGSQPALPPAGLVLGTTAILASLILSMGLVMVAVRVHRSIALAI